MKKLAIAGASLALAAMPVLGVFADDITTVVDTLTVTVASSCKFGSSTSGSVDAQDATKKTNAYSASNQTPGALVELGDTTLAIECNNSAGYKITPTMTSLTSTTGQPAGTAIPYNATTAIAGSQTWSATYTKNSSTTANFTSGTAVTGSSTMTDTYVIHYKVGLGADQEATTYSGTATYVLAPNI